jgi:hypothetical protein
MPLRDRDVDTYINETLGGESVTVELTDNDFANCRKDALRRYSRQNPVQRRIAHVVPPQNINKYRLQPGAYSAIFVELQGVLQTIETPVDSNTINLFNPLMTINTGYGGLGVPKAEDYELLLQWRQMTGREFSVEPDYWIHEDLQPDGSTEDEGDLAPMTMWIFNPSGMSVKASWVELSQRTLDRVSPRDEDWILDWAVAHAKQILGRKRGKVESIPMASQAIKLDGATLLAEAREEKDRLLEDLHYRFIGEVPAIWG